MTRAPVRFSPAAVRDVRAITRRHRADAGEAVALGFADALEAALRHIARHPASGSPRIAHALGLPGLGAWPLSRFPHLVFYRERPGVIDVLRVLHGSRDIPALLRDRRG